MSSKATNHIPPGGNALIPTLVVDDARKAIEYYKKVFGAEQVGPAMAGPDGTIMHAVLRIAGQQMFLAEPMMGSKSPLALGATHGSTYIYVADVDATVKRSVELGGTLNHPAQDMFWGDRFAQITDPFGHGWEIATFTTVYTPEEMQRGQEAWLESMKG